MPARPPARHLLAVGLVLSLAALRIPGRSPGCAIAHVDARLVLLRARLVIQQFGLMGLSPLEDLAHHACRQRSGKEGQGIYPDCRGVGAGPRACRTGECQSFPKLRLPAA